jgi:hypothetical protein
MVGRLGPMADAVRAGWATIARMENGDQAALAAPVAEPLQRRGMAATFWSLLFLGTAAGNVLAQWMRAWRDVQPFPALTVSIEEFSSALASLALLAVLHAAARRWPLHADTWRRRILLYVLGAIAWWLLHVSAMVLMRKLAFALIGQQYTYGAWPAQWFYEFFKDVQTYSLLVIAVHAVAWFGRQRQGEAHLLAEPDVGPPVEPVERPQHFLVRKLGKEFLVATEDVEYAQAAGNYVNLRVRGHDYPLRITMAVLEQRLDPVQFLRPHRSWLINRDQLRSIEPLDGGEALLHMVDGVKVPCSRRQLPLLRQALAGT